MALPRALRARRARTRRRRVARPLGRAASELRGSPGAPARSRLEATSGDRSGRRRPRRRERPLVDGRPLRPRLARRVDGTDRPLGGPARARSKPIGGARRARAARLTPRRAREGLGPRKRDLPAHSARSTSATSLSLRAPRRTCDGSHWSSSKQRGASPRRPDSLPVEAHHEPGTKRACRLVMRHEISPREGCRIGTARVPTVTPCRRSRV